MKKIEKITLLISVVNYGIWINLFWKKIDFSSAFIGLISFTIAYFIIYTFIKFLVEGFTKDLLEKTVNYFHEKYKIEQFNFTYFFYSDILREFTCYIFIILLLLDTFSILKFNFSLLSVINYIVNNSNEE